MKIFKKYFLFFFIIFFLFCKIYGIEKNNYENKKILKKEIIIENKKNINGDPKIGFELFKKNCTSCHSLDLNKKLIGPPLNGILERREKKWLYKWIKDSKSLIKKGDKIANDIYKEYNNLEMNSFPNLSKKDIENILSFINNPKYLKKNKNKIVNNSKIINSKIIKNNKINNIEKKIFIIGFFIFSLFIIILFIKVFYLNELIKSKSIEDYYKRISINKKIINNINYLIEIIVKYKFFNKIIFVSILFSLIFFIWNFFIKIDVNKGYQPKQPIYFSHKIHSGINKIDCQYCHSSAKYSKISGIPSANICMSCHYIINEYKGSYIEKGKNRDFYNNEIKKIYKYIGWNEKKLKYNKKVKPIEWIRIHNMQDFVYFDHSQHIKVGKKNIQKIKNISYDEQICSACHGKVDLMDEVKMVNNFTMEWCIKCHRKITINKDNNYYKHYFKNKELKKNENIGYIECSKCHY